MISTTRSPASRAARASASGGSAYGQPISAASKPELPAARSRAGKPDSSGNSHDRLAEKRSGAMATRELARGGVPAARRLQWRAGSSGDLRARAACRAGEKTGGPHLRGGAGRGGAWTSPPGCPQVSQAAAELLAFCETHAKDDPLVTPVPAAENPFRDKRLFCVLL